MNDIKCEILVIITHTLKTLKAIPDRSNIITDDLFAERCQVDIYDLQRVPELLNQLILSGKQRPVTSGIKMHIKTNTKHNYKKKEAI